MLTFVFKRLRLKDFQPRRFIKSVLVFTGIMSWLGITITSFYLYQVYQAIPSKESLSYESVRAYAESLMQPSEPTTLQTADLSADDLREQSDWVELKDINTDLIYAIILSEDPQFFNHKGINYDEFMNSLVGALTGTKKASARERVWDFGTGTISQQAARKLYLSRGESSVFTFSEPLTLKIQELIITYRLEQALTKRQILELYLNVIEFGSGLFGISNASHYYFDKDTSEVNAAEGVYLALLMPSPRNYHYTLFHNGNWSPALKKKHQNILRDMYHRNLIPKDLYHQYSNWLYYKKDYFDE